MGRKTALPYACVPGDFLVRKTPACVFSTWGVLWDHHSKETGITYPCVTRIARVTGYSERHVWRAIGWLLSEGYIAVHRAGDHVTPTQFRINWSKADPARKLQAAYDATPKGWRQLRRRDKNVTTLVTSMSATQCHECHTEEDTRKLTEVPRGTSTPASRPIVKDDGVITISPELQLRTDAYTAAAGPPKPYRHPLAPDPVPDA